jgi:prepilin-type N-terminal cleavage/methylation domain-containing protein
MIEEQRPSPGGFTLVEVIVALFVLSVGILGMAASTGYIFSHLKDAGGRTERTFATQQVVEELRAVPVSTNLPDEPGRTVGRYTVSWRVTPISSQYRLVEIETIGPGYVAGRGLVNDMADTTYISLSR